MIEWLKEYEYIMLLVLIVGLVWLYWLPRILTPIIAPRYKDLPPSIKSFLALILPTIEEVILNSWTGLYTDVLVPIVEETPTPLDNSALEEFNRLIQEALKGTSDDTEEIITATDDSGVNIFAEPPKYYAQDKPKQKSLFENNSK
jgi:hypothetical protein